MDINLQNRYLNGATRCVCVHQCYLQCEVVLQAGGDVQQCSACLTCAEHQLYMPRDGACSRRHVVPLQQTVTLETLRTRHNYSKKRLKSRLNVSREREGGRNDEWVIIIKSSLSSDRSKLLELNKISVYHIMMLNFIICLHNCTGNSNKLDTRISPSSHESVFHRVPRLSFTVQNDVHADFHIHLQ